MESRRAVELREVLRKHIPDSRLGCSHHLDTSVRRRAGGYDLKKVVRSLVDILAKPERTWTL